MNLLHDRVPSLRLVRRFIATGETRFPLAGVWSLVREASATTDATASAEPESPWLTVGVDLLRWALHPTLTFAC